MKIASRTVLLCIIAFSMIPSTISGYTNVASNRNAIWIEGSRLIDNAQAESYATVDINTKWEFDYDTEVAAAIWSINDGHYVEQVVTMVSGAGGKRYSLPFLTPDTNGEYTYRAEVLHKEGEDWVKATDGTLEFDVQVTGGKEPGALSGITSNLSLPAIPSLGAIPGYVYGVVGLLVGAIVMYLYMEYA